MGEVSMFTVLKPAASTTLWTYPIVQVDGRRIADGKPGRITQALKEELKREFIG
jgi:hypothetical protein